MDDRAQALGVRPTQGQIPVLLSTFGPRERRSTPGLGFLTG